MSKKARIEYTQLMIRVIFFIFSLFTFTQIIAAEFSIKNNLQYASPGDYLVLEQEKMATLLRITDRREGLLSFEEISIPIKVFLSKELSFREWYMLGADSNTSWTLSEIHLESGKLLKSYSFSQGQWLDTQSYNSFLSSLLNLSFQEIPYEKRKRAGLPPPYGKPDLRPLWQPKLIVNGEPLRSIPFDAYMAVWPSDESELSRKKIEIYLPTPTMEKTFPTFFPYYLEIEGKLGAPKMRVIDAGTSLFKP